MRFRHVLVIAAGGLVLNSAALAHENGSDAGFQPDLQTLFQGTVRESDVSLVFDYLRHALAATAAGREAPVPEELRERAEAIGNELRARGTLAALVMLSAMEARARQLLREGLPPPRSRLPPVAPFTATAAD